MFPSLYNGGWEHVTRKSPTFPSISQYGVENIPARFENLIDEDQKKLLDCDKFYNLWVDSLEFLNYPECLSCFNYWPRPEKELKYDDIKLPKKFLMFHPMARLDTERKLEKWYIEALVKEFAAEIPVVIITEEKYVEYYEFTAGWENVQVHATDLYEAWYIASKCSGFLGVDSSIRYFSMCYGVPNYVFNHFCNSPFVVPPSQIVRWANRPHSCLPPHWNKKEVKEIVLRAIDDYANYLYPEYSLAGRNISDTIVRRKFTNA